MTNGNDILEYEEHNSERLHTEWSKKKGIVFDDTEIFFSQDYWDYVTLEYSEGGREE